MGSTSSACGDEGSISSESGLHLAFVQTTTGLHLVCAWSTPGPQLSGCNTRVATSSQTPHVERLPAGDMVNTGCPRPPSRNLANLGLEDASRGLQCPSTSEACLRRDPPRPKLAFASSFRDKAVEIWFAHVNNLPVLGFQLCPLGGFSQSRQRMVHHWLAWLQVGNDQRRGTMARAGRNSLHAANKLVFNSRGAGGGLGRSSTPSVGDAMHDLRVRKALHGDRVALDWSSTCLHMETYNL